MRGLGSRGNISLMMALSAVPMIGMVALAIDFGQTTMVKAKLDLAADSAALLAATAASNAWKNGDTNAAQEGIAAGQARFQAQTGNQSDLSVNSYNVGLTQDGGQFSASVTYAATTPTTFARVLGITAINLSGQAAASLSINPYVDIQVLMDVSSSMTQAATQADAETMNTLTANFKPADAVPPSVTVGQSCQFACHWSASGGDYYALAQKHDVKLRLSVLQGAVGDMIATLAGLDTASQFQLGLYSFNNQFTTLYPLARDIQGAAAAVSAIQPAVNACSSACPETYFSGAMQALTKLDQGLAWSGTAVPRRFLFIVTDGVYDQLNGSDRQIGAFSPADCAGLKDLGVTILVLYTPYIPVPSNSQYTATVEPVMPGVVPNLTACASSPAGFFVASDAAGIDAQLQVMLQAAVLSSGHLTN
jgi:Flp pilus assembly protein TadG